MAVGHSAFKKLLQLCPGVFVCSNSKEEG